MEETHELVEITDPSGPSCKLCFRNAQTEDSAIQMGPLYEYGTCRAHHFCLMFSAGLEQKGEEEEGIMGFMPNDVIKEWKRGAFLKCIYCKQKYATLGCCVTGCRKGFHLPCGVENGSLQQFFGNFCSFCPDHRPVQNPVKKDGKKSDKDCGICLDTLSKKKIDNLWTPCCGGWFHRECVNRMASTAGIHFFKCPLCNNKDEFTQEMLDFGIYLPDQDAKWETEGEAFEDLLERPNRCDAPVCLCPEGREVDREDTDWETSICVCCGSQGIHFRCGNLNKERPRWKCDTCRSVVRSGPVKPVSVFGPVKRGQESARDISGLLSKIKFKVGPERKPFTNLCNIRLTIGRVQLELDSAPVLDVPKPVSLDKDSVVAKQRKRTDNKLATKLENNEGDRKASLNISPEPKPPVDPVKPQSPLKKPKEERLSPTKALVRASSERRSPFKSPSKAASDYSMCDTLSPRAGRKRKQTKEDDIDQEQADISSKKSYQPTSASTGKAQTSILSFFKVTPKFTPSATLTSSTPSLTSDPSLEVSTTNLLASSPNLKIAKAQPMISSPSRKARKTMTYDTNSPRKVLLDSSDDDGQDEVKEIPRREKEEDDATTVLVRSDDEDLVKAVEDESKLAPPRPNSSSAKSVGQFICQFCRMSFSSLLTWKQHENSHKGGHFCPICDKQYSYRARLKAHMKLHDEERDMDEGTETEDEEVVSNEDDCEDQAVEGPYRCNVCDVSFTEQRRLNHHLARHSSSVEESKIFQCSQCPDILVNKKALINHRESVHGIKPNPGECHVCDYVGARRRNLRVHLRLRHGEKTSRGRRKLQCDDCDFVGVNRKGLATHMRKHRRQKSGDVIKTIVVSDDEEDVIKTIVVGDDEEELTQDQDSTEESSIAEEQEIDESGGDKNHEGDGKGLSFDSDDIDAHEGFKEDEVSAERRLKLQSIIEDWE